MCPHCENRVKTAFEALDTVDEAIVSHEKGTAVLKASSDIPADVLKKTVTDAGYKYIGTKQIVNFYP